MSDAQPSTSRDDSSSEMIGDENANSVILFSFYFKLFSIIQPSFDFKQR